MLNNRITQIITSAQVFFPKIKTALALPACVRIIGIDNFSHNLLVVQ